MGSRAPSRRARRVAGDGAGGIAAGLVDPSVVTRAANPRADAWSAVRVERVEQAVGLEDALLKGFEEGCQGCQDCHISPGGHLAALAALAVLAALRWLDSRLRALYENGREARITPSGHLRP